MPYIRTVILSSWSLSDIVALELEKKSEILPAAMEMGPKVSLGIRSEQFRTAGCAGAGWGERETAKSRANSRQELCFVPGVDPCVSSVTS